MASSSSASRSSSPSESPATSLEDDADVFVHRPLETYSTIRILEVQPAAAFADPLVTRLDHRPLRDANGYSVMQDFIAVSYTWGQDKKSEQLNCQGALIPITPTVDGMLRRFRRSYKTRRLWLDAICLNQSDHAEKSSQIPQMRNIYQSAKKVFVWLGESPDPELNPLDNISLLMFQRQTSQQRVLLGLPAASVKSLLENVYWTRRWVIQEISSHPHTTLHLGDRKFPWKTFTSIILDLDNYRLESQAEKDSIQSLVNRVKTLTGPRRPIMDLLLRFHAAECSDPRDRLAALQVIATDAPDSDIKMWRVDYKASVFDNYLGFVEATIRSGYSDRLFDHLMLFGCLRDEENLSSWIPNWTRNISDPGPDSTASSDFRNLIWHFSHSVDFRKMVREHLAALPGTWNSLDHSQDPLEADSSVVSLVWDMSQRRSSSGLMESSLREFFGTVLEMAGTEANTFCQPEERVIRLLQWVLPLRKMYTKYCRKVIRQSDRAARIAWAWLAADCFPYRVDQSRAWYRLTRESCPAIRGLWSLSSGSDPGEIGLDFLDVGFLHDIVIPSFTELFWYYTIFATGSGQGIGFAERNIKGDNETYYLQEGDVVRWEAGKPGSQVFLRNGSEIDVIAVTLVQAWRVNPTRDQTPV